MILSIKVIVILYHIFADFSSPSERKISRRKASPIVRRAYTGISRSVRQSLGKDLQILEYIKRKLTVIGGDTRQLTAAMRLSADFDVALYGFNGPMHHQTPTDTACCSSAWNAPEHLAERVSAAGTLCMTPEEALADAAAVILPLPAGSDGSHVAMPLSGQELTFSALAAAMQAAHVPILCGGKLSPVVIARMENAGIRTFDYYEREEFAVANAVPTAEGAIAIAMRELQITLHRARALVIGYGRIGRILAGMLKALGADVVVSARKAADFAWIDAASLRGVPTPSLADVFAAERFDVIFNTVPHPVLGAREMAEIPPESLIIDLASAPGGIAPDAASRRVIWALSLPGKTAPVTAGTIIADTVKAILGEAGVC